MSNRKSLPVRAETAIAQAIRAVREIGGDELTIAALTQALVDDLDRAGFQVRPGFKFVARAVVDLSGRDKFADLKVRTDERIGEANAAAAGTTVAEMGGEFPIAGGR